MSDAVYEGPDFHPEAPKNTRAAGQGAAASGFSGAPRCHAAGEGQKPAGAASKAPQNENGGSVLSLAWQTYQSDPEEEAWHASPEGMRSNARLMFLRAEALWRDAEDLMRKADEKDVANAR